MDYITKPTSRKALREMSKAVRQIFGVDETSEFPVLDALEKLPDVFSGCTYKVVSNNELPIDTPAQCSSDDDGNFIIEIKQAVYDGAYKKRIGAYRVHITHEICHIFLFKIGFTPIYARSFENNQIEAYRSVEWQAKALCGEVMMPYDSTKNMERDEIIKKYGVSKASANKRLTY